jgi:hypothetical protein
VTVRTVVRQQHTRNHLYSGVVDDSGIPEVERTGEDVDVTHWRVPLCTTWSFTEKDKRIGGSLGDRRLKGVLVGYAPDSPRATRGIRRAGETVLQSAVC